MDGKKRRDAKWADLEGYVQEELRQARQRALLADSFDEMEEMVVEVGQRLQRAILAAAAEQRQPGGGQRCPGCGAKMENKGLKSRQMKTSVGKVRFERERWACPECGRGVFPPGSEAED